MSPGLRLNMYEEARPMARKLNAYVNNSIDDISIFSEIERTISALYLARDKAIAICDNKLLSDKIAVSASIIAKDKKIRDIVHKFQQRCAYSPPLKYMGSILDGRDIITVQMKDAKFKFFITASIRERARRRYKELKSINKKITLKMVLKSLKNRDKSDRERKHGPLKKTKDSILINTTKLSKKACFKKIKANMDRKLRN